MKIFFLSICMAFQFVARAQPSIPMDTVAIKLKKGISFTLQVPKGYGLSIAYEGLNRPRFFSLSPDGRLFVTDLFDRSDNKKGKVLILDGWNPSTKKFSKLITYLDQLHNPNQVGFYSRNGKTYIYIAETHQLSRFDYSHGDSMPPKPGTQLARFPDYGLSYKYGGWHLTRSICFGKNQLYVSVGSSCDACIEKEEIRATITRMDPIDGSGKTIIARGLRNAVGIKFVKDELWVTNMGRDNRGPDKPEEQLMRIKEDEFYGWPYYFQYRKQVITDPAFKDSARAPWVKKPPISQWGIQAHSAPLGFCYVENFTDSLLNHSFLTALHGSTSVWRQRGNAVVQMQSNGKYREIVSGFLQGKTEDKRYGRPCDVLQWDDHSLFISDDKNGVIYYLWKKD